MITTLATVSKEKLKSPPLKVHTLGDRDLRQPAKRVSKITDEIRQLAIDMLKTMYSCDGIGLAAPQVGIAKQIIVIDIHPDQPDAAPMVMINPEVKATGGSLVNGEEGCLSIPNVFMDVVRPNEVTVSYRDLEGKPQKLTTSDLLARVILHEVDHLNGVVFVDRVKNQAALGQELSKRGFKIKDVQPLPA
ncbi:MAG: peptide deformylase [Oscillatoriales cyanobacterium SM2_2_1]|nr:peptide deformylase [Oscillatoriales cyanobacterium SM2_2_1]